MSEQTASHEAVNPLVKLALEVGPLAIFFAVNAYAGIFAGTAAFMVAITISLIALYSLTGKIAMVPLLSGALVMVFGGLTLWLHDELFIKLKPTIVNLLFGIALLGGLVAGKSLLKPVFGAMFKLTEEGWRGLTLRWGLFFLFLALLNEIVWRNVSTDTWVSFKVFGLLPLTLVFALAQTGYLQRHEIDRLGEEDR